MATLDDYVRYCFAKDLDSDRFKALPADEQHALIGEGRDRCLPAWNKLLAAIEQKDLATLIQLLWTHNKFFRKVFQERTGVSLGTTNSQTESALYEYAGPEIVQAYQQQLQTEAEARATRDREAAEAAANKERDEYLGQQIRWRTGNGQTQTTTRKQFIDSIFAEGYRPEEAKRGFAKMVRMVCGTSHFTLTHKHEMAYAMSLVESEPAHA